MGKTPRVIRFLMAILLVPFSFRRLAADPALADRISLEIRQNEELAIKDVLVGRLDAILTQLPREAIDLLPESDRRSLIAMSSPSGAFSLLLNPAPNGPPYLARDTEGRELFNVMAIRGVRLALNRLVDRKAIGEEILLSGGLAPRFTAAIGGSASATACERIALELGFQPEGQGSALADIEAALREAAELPELRGRLRGSPSPAGSGTPAWSFDGEPVKVRILARSDDVNRRLRIGRYLADLLERAGLRPELLAYERARCSRLVSGTDPARLEWQIFTEQWQGNSGEYVGDTLAQMYCPSFGSLTGHLAEGFWSYRDEGLEILGGRFIAARQLTRAEYDGDRDALLRKGLEDSVRIFLAADSPIYIANRDRLAKAPLYDRQGGLETWLCRSASPRPDGDGQGELRLAIASTDSSSFLQGDWEPVGCEGFWGPCQWITGAILTDEAFVVDPATGTDAEGACRLVAFEDGGGEGVDLGPRALAWDGAAASWGAPAPGLRSRCKLTLDYLPLPWHSGSGLAAADAVHRAALVKDWGEDGGPDDPAFDPQIASSFASGDVLAAIEPISESRIAFYLDAGWTFDPPHVAAAFAPRWRYVPWEIAEALCLLVLEGSASGTRYAFSAAEGQVLPDLIKGACVADIAAKLRDMRLRRHVPASLRGLVDAQAAVGRYSRALDFIQKTGHAFIGNGPFFLSRISKDGSALRFDAFRDYPRAAGYWYGRFARELPRVMEPRFTLPAPGRDFPVGVQATLERFPEGTRRAADSSVAVRVSIGAAGPALELEATQVAPGLFRAVFSSKRLASLGAGRFLVSAEARIGDSPPSISSSILAIEP